jgi:DNA-binding response OmpR family regulator
MMVLIDDNDLFRTALAANLREDGYDVSEFATPGSVTPGRLHDVEAAIIGCNRGLNEAFPLARRFHDAWPEVPIIVLTRWWAEPTLKAHPDYLVVLPKPLDYEALAGVLRDRVRAR